MKVYLDGVVDGDSFRLKQRFHIVRVGRKNADLLFEFFQLGIDRKIFLKFDVFRVELIVNDRFLILREFELVQNRVDLAERQRTFLLAFFNELFQRLFLFVDRVLLFICFLFRHSCFLPAIP